MADQGTHGCVPLPDFCALGVGNCDSSVRGQLPCWPHRLSGSVLRQVTMAAHHLVTFHEYYQVHSAIPSK